MAEWLHDDTPNDLLEWRKQNYKKLELIFAIYHMDGNKLHQKLQEK